MRRGAIAPRWHAVRRRARAMRSGWGPEGGDALLYGGSALFALANGAFAGLAGYRLWGWLALGPYGAAAVVSALVGRARAARSGTATKAATSAAPGGVPAAVAPGEGRRHHFGPARVWVFLAVLMGATILPLSVAVALRGPSGVGTTHVQPEVVVIDQAGARLAHGKNVYHATVHDGQVRSVVPGEPVYESFFPYLPLMATFGLPSTSHAPVRVTDTRIVFSVVTLLVVGAALLLLRAPKDHKMRAGQFLAVLPSAALPLATGGDDMPIVALLLLALVLAQRRRPGWSGFVFGIVSAMKFTAWPLAALALFAARDRRGNRAPGRMLAGMAVVAVPVVVPFALTNLRAFFDNVVLFPLGLSGVRSPAASNLPGHVLVTELPALHTALPVAAAVVGGLVLLRHLARRPPRDAATVATLAGWVMLVAILVAPATRVGYLLYPANFFVWGWLLRAADRRDGVDDLLAPPDALDDLAAVPATGSG